MAYRSSEFMLCMQMAKNKSSRKYWTEAEPGLWQLEVSVETETLAHVSYHINFMLACSHIIDSRVSKLSILVSSF